MGMGWVALESDTMTGQGTGGNGGKFGLTTDRLLQICLTNTSLSGAMPHFHVRILMDTSQAGVVQRRCTMNSSIPEDEI